MKRRFNLLAVLIVILGAGSGSLGAQVPVTYRFSADNLLLSTGDPILAQLLTGALPEGTFTYDSSVEQTGTSGEQF